MDELEVREQVDHLLLPVVVAARRAIRREPELLQLFLVLLGVRAGGEQEHDLARGCSPSVDELPHTARDMSRLRAAPLVAGHGLLVRYEQLERPAEQRRPIPRGRLERLELVTERRAEELVDRTEHLGARPVVEGQRERDVGGVATFAEHGHIRMPEAVDRLELVSDREQVDVGAFGQKVEDLGLQPVRVLELIDHHGPEP